MGETLGCFLYHVLLGQVAGYGINTDQGASGAGCHICCAGASQVEEYRMKAFRINYTTYTEVFNLAGWTK